jgi:hypothetical protein
MYMRTHSAAILGITALVLSGLPTGSASAADQAEVRTSHSGVSVTAAGVSSTSAHSSDSTAPTGDGACGTSFGAPPEPPDGIIAWNDGSGVSYDTAGAVDVVCSAVTYIQGVDVYGYFGDPSGTDQFHLTFWSGDSEPGGSLCDYTVPGASGGIYSDDLLTHLDISDTPCQLPAGVSWVSVQNVNPSQPWYWEVQDPRNGQYPPDFRDVHNVFASGCTTFPNTRYLQDCLGYSYGDFMLSLSGLTCTISGTEAGDILVGTPGDDIICGLGERDLLRGRKGNDILLAGDGNDELRGNKGNDLLYGESGNDFLKGKRNNDTLVDHDGADYFRGNAGADSLDSADGVGDDNVKGGVGTDSCTIDAGDTLVSC